MVKRSFFVHKWVRYLDFANRSIPGDFSHVWHAASGSRLFDGICQKDIRRFELFLHGNGQAINWLGNFGLRKGQQFVCLVVWNSAYSDAVSQRHKEVPRNLNDYSYRVPDIEHYSNAIYYLIDKGYLIIRMGKTAFKKMLLRHKKLKDYPFLLHQNDLMISGWQSSTVNFYMLWSWKFVACLHGAFNIKPLRVAHLRSEVLAQDNLDDKASQIETFAKTSVAWRADVTFLWCVCELRVSWDVHHRFGCWWNMRFRDREWAVDFWAMGGFCGWRLAAGAALGKIHKCTKILQVPYLFHSEAKCGVSFLQKWAMACRPSILANFLLLFRRFRIFIP